MRLWFLPFRGYSTHLIDHLRLHEDVGQSEQSHCAQNSHEDSAQEQETAAFGQQCGATQRDEDDAGADKSSNDHLRFNRNDQIQ